MCFHLEQCFLSQKIHFYLINCIHTFPSNPNPWKFWSTIFCACIKATGLEQKGLMNFEYILFEINNFWLLEFWNLPEWCTGRVNCLAICAKDLHHLGKLWKTSSGKSRFSWIVQMVCFKIWPNQNEPRAEHDKKWGHWLVWTVLKLFVGYIYFLTTFQLQTNTISISAAVAEYTCGCSLVEGTKGNYCSKLNTMKVFFLSRGHEDCLDTSKEGINIPIIKKGDGWRSVWLDQREYGPS